MLRFKIYLGKTEVRHYMQPSSVSRYCRAFQDFKGIEIVAYLYGVHQGRYSSREWIQDDLEKYYHGVLDAERQARKQGHIKGD